jgi:hypothetical protein
MLLTQAPTPRGTPSVLAETRLEERDGSTWVSGLCPYCWERYFFRAPPVGTTVTVRCPNEHTLQIVDQTSEGSQARGLA